MSGLQPRTSGEQNATYSDLTVQTLGVNLVAYINTLVVTTLNVANSIYNSITTSNIVGNPSIGLSTGGNNRLNIPTSGIVNNNTDTELLTINSSTKNLEYRTVGSLPVINPFNQSLNTTDDVTFNNEDLNGYSRVMGQRQGSTQTVNCIQSGLDTLDQARVTCFSPVGTNGYFDVSQSDGLNSYRGRLGYDLSANEWGIRVNGNIAPSAVINSSYLQSTAIRANVFNDNGGGNGAYINGDQATNKTNSQTLSNKTIDSASNTLTVTNTPLSAVNVNSLINQDVRTTANVIFSSIGATGIKPSSPSVKGVYLGTDVGNAVGIEMTGADSNSLEYIDFSYSGSDFRGRILYSNNGDTLTFSTGAGTNALLLANSNAYFYNNVGIGTLPTGVRLTIAGYIETTATISVSQGATNIIGTGGTVTVSGTGLSFTVTITTGTGVGAVGVIGTFTVGIALPDTGYNISVTPKNVTAGGYNGKFWVNNLSVTQFTIFNVSGNLTNNSTYILGCILMS